MPIHKPIIGLFRGIFTFFKLLVAAGKEFSKDDAFRHGAALSYYTVFALPPILIILISAIGFVIGEKEIETRIFSEMNEMFGEDGARQVQAMVSNIQSEGTSIVATIIGIAALLFSSTAVFYSLQKSLNTFWKVGDGGRGGFFKTVIDRMLSFAMILSVGFLLVVSLAMEALIAAINDYLADMFPDMTVYFVFITKFAVALLVNTLMFVMIYKFLPDAKIKWKVALVGGLFTAFMFDLGEFGIGWYLGHTDIASTYGPAGSILLIFLWIFYSSQMIFFGAEFTYVYAKHSNNEITPMVRKKKNLGETDNVPLTE